MPVIAMPLFWGAMAAGAGAGAQIYSANRTANANTEAAHLAADAANRAGDLQAHAADESLAFTRSEAARAQANFEATQHANYDQWAAREQRLSALGVLAGLAPRQIPGYVPTSAGGASGAPGASGTPAGVQVSNAAPDFLRGLLSRGVPIQDAITQANQRFGSCTTRAPARSASRMATAARSAAIS